MIRLEKIIVFLLCYLKLCCSRDLSRPWNFFSLGKFIPSKNTTNSIHTSPIHSNNIDSEVNNVVIIGSGPAGCTAAIYAARALLKPMVIAGYQAGGQLMLTSDVENFPGYKTAITGPELMDDLMIQAKSFGAEFLHINCKSIDTSNHPYIITLSNNRNVSTKAVIIGTGADALWLNAEDEEKYRGKGISACATCDGYLFCNKSVIVIGGGDSAMEEALFLTRFASKVTIVHRRDTFKASKLMFQRAFTHPKIKMMTGYKVIKWLGSKDILSGAIIENISNHTQQTLFCEGAFIAIGHKPNSAFLGPQVTRDNDGFIKIKENTMTNIPGIFACGDVVDRRYKQAITAAGSGCQAAIDAERWLEENFP